MFIPRKTRGWFAAAGTLCLMNGLLSHPAQGQSPHPGLLGGFGQGSPAVGGLGGMVGGVPGAANGLGLSPLFVPIAGGNGGAQMTPDQMAAMQMMMMAGMAGGYGGVKTGLNPGMMSPGMMPGMGMMQGGLGDAGDDPPQVAPKRRRHRAAREPKAKARPAKAAAARKQPRR